MLTLDCTGPNFTDPSATDRYQDVIEFINPNQRRLTARVRGPNGTWTQMMHAVFDRVGA